MCRIGIIGMLSVLIFVFSTGCGQNLSSHSSVESMESAKGVMQLSLQSDSDDGFQRSYSYEEDGCKTGEHVFYSLTDYCEGLKNEELNHGCAKDLRDAEYRLSCLAAE